MPGSARTQVVVTGLRETLNAIKAMEEQAPKAMRDSMKRVALVAVENIKTKVPRRRGKAAASVRPRGGVKGVGIAVGGATAPYFGWLDFGGTTGRGHRRGQPRTGSVYRRYLGVPVGDGRYLYPGVKDSAEDVQDAFVEELNGLLRMYGMKAE